ncbi:hypothetical protein [Pseudomonas sp. EMN2]|uniref:hypothetical protein n=1 Tax=Pseudomonas sp. EMN2 TaxID=2615212 RepID=UPI00129B08CA|nr:hypothetical protein [Pseudomonas sp. EMN2]
MRRFDDRQKCFLSGKMVSPPTNERRQCACCGLRIVKGHIVEIGHVGEDCADIIRRYQYDAKLLGLSVDDFAAKYKRSTGWTLKPVVKRTLNSHYAPAVTQE